MRNARPTRRQIEANSDDLGFDALTITPAGVDALVASDEVTAVEDLLADAGYMAVDLPEFDFEPRTLAEFETEISPAPVVELATWSVAGLPGQGKSAGALAALYDFGEVA
ncbi:hypothetical protein ACFQ05_04460 [Amycolatopsis umgeniensis]|uniref:Uncharacterized protein n=1 Tax=Amycolatopsis umgeniensis TaxID=336628 RepID=A0A841AUH3_9PSEU|nr:hypothetical protein [Amycolatopsis umgeniensis]MBB5852519.1 hypothetical protein [Amycolatopsis umgeniensis]